VPDLAEHFAENLAYYHGLSGLSQEALASRAEIHRTQVGDLLRGKQMPRLDTLIKLAGALGVPPADLIEGLEFEPADQRGKFKFSQPKRKK
jgi:transcriptional regulator with XRE-family HTH domain